MPEPLAMPPSRHVLPPHSNSTAAVFSTRSVVRMARFASADASALSDSFAASASMLPSMASMLSRWPMTPVEPTSTHDGSTPVALAAAAAMRRAFSMPSGAQAFALPELATIACATPFSSCSMQT